jgi:hypothetical protein
MARLFDDIIRGKRLHLLSSGKLVDEQLRSAKIIVSDNVTQYYYADSEREFWEIPDDFPNLAPPFENFFIETRRPTHINSEGKIIDWDLGLSDKDLAEAKTFDSNGNLTDHVVGLSKKIYRPRPKRWGAWFVNLDASLLWSSESYKYIPVDAKAQVKWLVGILVFIDMADEGEKEPRIVPTWKWVMAIDKEGKPIPSPIFSIRGFAWLSYPVGEIADMLGFKFYQDEHHQGQVRNDKVEFAHQISTEMIGYLKPLLLAVSFLHCKNVKSIAQSPPAKVQKKRLSAGKPPLCTYHILNIQPMRQVLVREGGGETGTAGQRAFHICRGHFKTYSSEKPLLGRAAGTFWWPQQVRGSKQHGVVVSDANLHLPSLGDAWCQTPSRSYNPTANLPVSRRHETLCSCLLRLKQDILLYLPSDLGPGSGGNAAPQPRFPSCC